MANENQNQAGGPGSLQPGYKIDKYEVLEVLGAGGQSIVYKCRDELLDRLVAIKQICTPLAQDPDYLQQLRNTIRTIAKLGSKNEAIITIYELIENQQGLFYVMEFVEGHTLETLIREADGPIETKALLLILFRMAAALHEIHNAGIVHRDIKPSNIVMTPGLRPKMIDFGVAAIGGGDASMPLATTKYLAPELYSGGEADGRADIYSLGFIAYEALVGREKFKEVFADVMRDPHTESLRWMKWHSDQHVQAPAVHEVNPAVPEPLSQIVAKMMAKDPNERYESMEALGRDIKASFSPRMRAESGAGAPVPAAAPPVA
ncbi:MAG: serine/threonine protein kinase, partial [Phycisphaerae bacterium]|nr:serine/threonine protein kinase [Phycisphaerae bacterium]